MAIDKEKLDKYYEAPEQDTLIINVNTQIQVAEDQEETPEMVKQSIEEEFGEISSVDNDSTLKEKFLGRTNYKKAYNDLQENAIDLWYIDPYYGRVDETGAIARIEPNPDSYAPDFILSALRAASKEFFKKIKVRESMIKNVNIIQGRQNERELHDQHLEELYQNFYNSILAPLQDSNKIKNIDDFYVLLKDYAHQQEIPLTTAGFMESLKNNPFTTGLVYEILDLDPSSDTQKVKFYEDPNFKVYKYVVNRHGFRIDPNVPWRIIADLSSINLFNYIKKEDKRFEKFSFSKVEVKDIIDELYTPYASYATVSKSYNGFYNVLMGFYSRFIKEFPKYNVVSIKSQHYSSYNAIQRSSQTRTTWEVKEREQASYLSEDVLAINPKFIEWYLDVRNSERKKPLNRSQVKQLKLTIRHIHNNVINRDETELTKEGDPNILIVKDEMLNYMIAMIEYSMGSIKANSVKTLTKKEKDIILVPQLSERPQEVASDAVGEYSSLKEVSGGVASEISEVDLISIA